MGDIRPIVMELLSPEKFQERIEAFANEKVLDKYGVRVQINRKHIGNAHEKAKPEIVYFIDQIRLDGLAARTDGFLRALLGPIGFYLISEDVVDWDGDTSEFENKLADSADDPAFAEYGLLYIQKMRRMFPVHFVAELAAIIIGVSIDRLVALKLGPSYYDLMQALCAHLEDRPEDAYHILELLEIRWPDPVDQDTPAKAEWGDQSEDD